MEHLLIKCVVYGDHGRRAILKCTVKKAVVRVVVYLAWIRDGHEGVTL